MKNIIQFKLKVFISSAMSNENQTQWKSIRKSIVKTLSKCAYLEPYKIEDHTSEISSTQLFSYRVRQSDIVVILIQNELRPGTEQEIQIALSEKKPILVYFINSNNLNEIASKFKKYISLEDLSTYRELESFENIDQIVSNDIINNLIDYYKYQHINNIDSSQVAPSISNESIFKNNIFEKKSLKFFGNNQNTLIDIFSLENYSNKINQTNENNIGNKLLKFLFQGETIVDIADTESMLNKLSLPKNILSILHLRYKALIEYFKGSNINALSYLENALNSDDHVEIPQWLLNDILIDCRNIQNKIDPLNNKFQKQINNLDNLLYFPLGDRLIGNAFEVLEKDKQKRKSASPSTIFFGNSLIESLQCMENYIYTSFMIGSITHLSLAKEKTVDLFLEYGDLYKDQNLIFQAIKLMVILGKTQLFPKIVNKYWDKAGNLLSIKSDLLWNLTKNENCKNSSEMKKLVFEHFGQYLDAPNFLTATAFMIEESQKIDSLESAKKLLKAVNNNQKQMENSIVLSVAINVLTSKKLIIYSEFTNLLTNIDLSNCDKKLIDQLNSLLIKNLDKILQNNGNPYFIINLVNQDKRFASLYQTIIEKIPEIESEFINLNLGKHQSVVEIASKSISVLEKRLKATSKTQVVYKTNPLAMIINISQTELSQELVSTLNQRFFPIAIKALSSEISSLDIKESYLKSLISLLIEYKKNYIEVPQNLIDYFSSETILLREDSLLPVSIVSSKYYINAIKFLLDVENENDIFIDCANYKTRGKNDRVSFCFSLQSYIKYSLISNKNIPLFIELVVFELLRDDYFVVRKNAIKCILLLYKTTPSELIKKELIQITLDSSPNIKGFYIRQLEKNVINKKDTIELLTLLTNDASFNIRDDSKKAIQNIQSSNY